MIVCICNVIRDKDLQIAAQGCRGDANDVYASLGKRPQCGQCLEEASEILDAARIGSNCLQMA